MNQAKRLVALLAALGLASAWCWWQIRALGDPRYHLGAFFRWYGAGFLLYLMALWIIGRRTRSPGRQTHGGASVVLIVAGAVVFRAFLLTATPVLSDDIYRYQWDGRVQAAGHDPYAYPPNAEALRPLRTPESAKINFPHLRTVYPPLTQLAFRLGTHLGGSLTAHKAVFVGLELLLMLALWALLRRRGQPALWVLAYAWHPLPILEIAGSGHNDVLGMAMLWLGVLAWQARSSFGAALGWGASFLAKFTSALLLPWWWFRRQGRGWIIAFLALAVVPIALRPTMLSALAESLSAMVTRFESNASVFWLLVWATGHASVARLLAGALGAGFALWWAHREADPVRYLAGVLGAAALLSPVLHPWYVVWLIPCFCFWRIPAFLALSGTVVLMYTVWPGYLAEGRWMMPLWVHVLEYVPVFGLLMWEGWRCVLRSSFQLAMKRAQLAGS